MSGDKLLLVSPMFHGYASSIAAAFEAIGYEVAVHGYDRVRTPIDSYANRAHHRGSNAAGWAAGRAAEGAISRLRAERPDRVLVIKGDQLGIAWWQELAASGAPSALWFYDELRRMSYSSELLGELGIPLASYSTADVRALCGQGLRAVHVPLGFDHLLRFEPRPSRAVTFIGARYANRERLLVALSEQGIEIRAYGRDWSAHPWDVLRTSRLGRPPLPGVRGGREIGRAEAYGIMAGSLAALNVHGDQDGFTMRTFEAAGVGGAQLIDRRDVDALYAPDQEVLAFERAPEAIAHIERLTADARFATRLRERARARTLGEHTFVHRARALEELWR